MNLSLLPAEWKTPDIEGRMAANGNYPKWKHAFEQLCEFKSAIYDFNSAAVSIGGKNELSAEERAQLKTALKTLIPWRKGPFSLFGIDIDAEWRSNLKWERVADELNFADKKILDVGAGNGYYMWRMIGAGARLVIGVDPYALYVMQFMLCHDLLVNPHPLILLPLTSAQVPPNLNYFDMVLSMGVLYHHKCPFTHLTELKSALKPGGELVLETLIVEGGQGYSLVPENRYAKMKNVWQLPSIETLISWLKRVGFGDISVGDINATSLEEQRTTAWSKNESLKDFLKPRDLTRTIEGYPAPRRAIVLARK